MSQAVHLLVVDPDDDVREVICELLIDLGCRVSLARDADAMRPFVGSPDRVDVMVLDAILSDAEEVTLAVQARDKGIRLVMR
jgi:DNA-binding NtrC family response regulator